MNNHEIESLTYVIELLDASIEQQQQNVDDWLARVEFVKSEGWDDMTAHAARILQNSMNELQQLRKHREHLLGLKKKAITA